MLEIIWIVWLMSWVAASFWSDRAQKRAATLETWIYRAAMVAGGILLVPWTGQLLEEKPIWEVGHAGLYVLAAVMLAGLSLTWWARIYLGRLWSSVITRKEDHKIIDTGPMRSCVTRSIAGSSSRFWRQRSLTEKRRRYSAARSSSLVCCKRPGRRNAFW
jgi:protein-S-isoprenylcysteine O-methyltransferase Ste14